MIIVNPNNTSHTISIVPRFDVIPASIEVSRFIDRVDSDAGIVEDADCVTDAVSVDFLGLIISDGFKGTSVSLDNLFDIVDGKLVITFDYTFRSESRYDIAVTYLNTSEVIYRGAAVATTQDTQEYKLTNDKFYY
tara:strand:- start:898 stop:1302 length:405 start_codon:yes stop_codon:yes gene_type:complete